MSTSTRYQPKGRHNSGWLVFTPWIRSTGTDWLLRLVRPRVTRSPREDSDRVKLNMAKTRRPITETTPIARGIRPGRAYGVTSRIEVTTSTPTVEPAVTSHSVEARKLSTIRCGDTV